MYLKLRAFASLTPLLALVICSVTPCVYSWGHNGHAVVATIAQIYTRPAALDSICQLLSPGETSLTQSPCSLASVASWADTNKGQMLWSAPLHYVGAVDDKPPNACAFPGPNGWNGQPGVNVFAGIHNTSQILLDWASHDSNGPSVGLATEALKFIIHFFGDVQMPLHLTGFLRGGNQAAVCLNGEKENLHYVWDNLLPDHAIAQVPDIYTHPLPSSRVEGCLFGSIYDPYVRRIVWEGIEGRWAGDLFNWVSCPPVQALPSSSPSTPIWRALLDFFLPGWAVNNVVDSSFPADNAVVCPYHWGTSTHDILCDLAWPKELDQDPSTYPASRQCVVADQEKVLYELNNTDYMGPIQANMILEEQLAKGGIRLATVLNYIFDGQSKV